VVIAGGLFWTKDSHGLDAADTFTTLAITALVTGPMSKLLIGFPQVTSLLTCFSRIQDFLLLENLPGRNSSPDTGMGRTDRDHLWIGSHTDRLMAAVELEDRKAEPYCRQTATSAAAIVFADATISPVPQAEPVLTGLSLEIQHSAINMVLGPTGSGKSTFLKAILGEASIVHGSVATSASVIGYCDQTCWLRNVSIQQNIVGPLDLDPVWYLEVVRCCMLEEDLHDMPSGDQSLVGSGGALLSGGQKQRVVRQNHRDCESGAM
jgi:ABC-type bacteriocin/lantibiotic exporter with double-glycine peptidase domain